nr:hypothetical protein Iba_chr07bCG14050 [Ipomoea batatas]
MMEGVMVSLVQGVKEKLRGIGSETVAKQLQVKVKEMIADILIDNVVEKFQDWVRGYKHYYYFVFFLLLFLGGCYCCCCGCAAVRGGRRRGKGAGKTMKAPGGSLGRRKNDPLYRIGLSLFTATSAVVTEHEQNDRRKIRRDSLHLLDLLLFVLLWLLLELSSCIHGTR